MRFLKFLMSLSILILEKLMNILWTDSNGLMQFLNLSVDRPIKEKHLFCLSQQPPVQLVVCPKP